MVIINYQNVKDEIVKHSPKPIYPDHVNKFKVLEQNRVENVVDSSTITRNVNKQKM